MSMTIAFSAFLNFKPYYLFDVLILSAIEPGPEPDSDLNPTSTEDGLPSEREASLDSHPAVSVVGQHTVPSLPTEGVQLDLGLHETTPHEVTRKSIYQPYKQYVVSNQPKRYVLLRYKHTSVEQ